MTGRRLSIFCFIGLLVSLTACNPLTAFNGLDQWFDRGTPLADGNFTPKDHWEGHWKVVNIWARWCKPCWQEMPELNRFSALQGSAEVKVLGYNFDQLEQSALKSLISEMDIQFPVLLSWPDIWKFPDVKGLPATLLIAPDNSLVKVLWGPQTATSLKEEILLAQALLSANINE